MGLTFPNPVGLAAGLDKNGDCIDGLASLGFGFLELGTVTPKPQPGNPKPRMFRMPKAEGLINRMGYYRDKAVRVEFFGDEIDRISEFNPVNGQVTRTLQHIAIY